MFQIGGIGGFQQFQGFAYVGAIQQAQPLLSYSVQNLLSFGPAQADQVSYKNGVLKGGWSLSLPIYDTQGVQGANHIMAQESNGALQARDQVVLDWNGDGSINTKGRFTPSDRVSFDTDGDGVLDRTEWPNGDAQLVYDANGDGIVNDGKELMNRVGINGEQGKYQNGWAKACDLFDTNQDGLIYGDELQKVSLWVDSNSDGITDAGELLSAEALGIQYVDPRSGNVMMQRQTDSMDMNSNETITAKGFNEPYYFPTFNQTGGTDYFGQPFTRFDQYGGQWNIPSLYWTNPSFR